VMRQVDFSLVALLTCGGATNPRVEFTPVHHGACVDPPLRITFDRASG
jgi:hypothetical protein